MPRPQKCRRVSFMPGVTYFKPAGVSCKELEEVQVSIEEAESIRLKDIEDLEQEQCADRMNISRPTFQRVLESARKKIADALLNGKAIKIGGGNYETAPLHMTCPHGHEWEFDFVNSKEDVPFCPRCQKPAVEPSVSRCHKTGGPRCNEKVKENIS